jgi:hypothetical protein
MPQAGVSLHPEALWSDHEWEESATAGATPVRAPSSVSAHPAPGVPAQSRPGAPARSRVEAAIPERPAQGEAARPDGTGVHARPDGTGVHARPDGTGVHARPDGTGVPGRRTVKITGYGSQRNLIYASREPRRRPTERPYERAGFKPDRVAMWAVLLGVLLVLVAAMSAHAATLVTLSGH